MSLGEVGRELRGVLDMIDRDRVTVSALRARMTAVRSQVAALTAGAADPLVARMIAEWDASAERLTEVTNHLSRALAAIREYATLIGVNVGPAPAPDPPGGVPVPARVRHLAERLAPWRQGQDTVGYAYDIDKGSVNDERFVSGRRPDAGLGLRQVRGLGLPAVVTDHAEGHVAARMRAPDGPRDVVLVLNNPPCQYIPYGCHRLLPDIMPTGATLDVYVKDDNGVRFAHRYTGTGRGIAT